MKNENGRRVWRNKENKNLFADKSYSWVDYVCLIDETINREVVGGLTYTLFEKQLDQWEDVTDFIYSQPLGRNYKDAFKKDQELDTFVQLLTDPENQPHQYIYSPELLKKRLLELIEARKQ